VSASFPVGVPADGNVKVVFVPTIADPKAPTLAELNATSALDITCGVTGGGFTTSTDVQTLTDERLCSTQTFEDVGTFTYAIDDIEYIIDPQDVSPTGENKIYKTLVPGTAGFIVVRYGVAYDTAFAAGDVVDVYPVKLGPQVKSAPERNTKLRAKQKPYTIAPGAQVDVTLAA